MEIERNVEVLRSREERLVLGGVEKKIAAKPIDERATKSEAIHRPFELVGRGVGLAHGQMSKACKAVRVLIDDAGERVVGSSCEIDPELPLEEIGAGARRR